MISPAIARFTNGFIKVTGWPVEFACLHPRILYEDRAVQGRSFRGPAIIVSNHTSTIDYMMLLFVFFRRTVRWQMAELQFRRPGLNVLLRLLGSIEVDRFSHNFAFLSESEEILRRGGAVGIFPEARLPRPGEERPLPFKPSAAYLSLATGVPIIPVYTNGAYFRKGRRAAVIIGKPISAAELLPDGADEKAGIAAVSDAVREKIISLGKELTQYEP